MASFKAQSGFTSPTTTKGDIIVRTSTTDVRQAIGSNEQVLVADSAQTNGMRYADNTEPFTAINYSITHSVAANALTIALKDAAGNNCSATSVAKLSFRNSSLASGLNLLRTITGSLSLVISSGSTLGQTDGNQSTIWVYAIDNAGTVELAVCGLLLNENATYNTTAEGGAGAADSKTTLYSTTSRTGVAIRLIGKITNSQTTAGTWAATGSNYSNTYGIVNALDNSGPTVQKFLSGSGTYVLPNGCRWIRVVGVGGGGGGSATGSAGSLGGGTGGTTTFGTSLLTANGGVGGPYRGVAAGGTATVASPAVGMAVTGGGGGGIFLDPTATAQNIGGAAGGPSMLGGNGSGSPYNAAGNAGSTNTGGGGGGGGNNARNDVSAGSGGGGGGGFDAIIYQPAQTYAYAVGAAGSHQGAGTNGMAGADGGSGVIYVYEFYT